MKKAFTLIELLLALVLTMMIVYFSYSFLSDSKAKSRWNGEVDSRYFDKSEKIKLLYDDLFYSSSFGVEGGKNFAILRLKTQNSIHGIAEPYVVWLVLKDSNELVRLESRDNIVLPMPERAIYATFMDEIGKDCLAFKVYQSAVKTDMMAFVEFKAQKPFIFEVPKQFQQ